MQFDESLINQKKYLCPVCSLSTFDAPRVMQKTRGTIYNNTNLTTDGQGNSYPAPINYYDIQCYSCGFNFRVHVV